MIHATGSAYVSAVLPDYVPFPFRIFKWEHVVTYFSPFWNMLLFLFHQEKSMSLNTQDPLYAELP